MIYLFFFLGDIAMGKSSRDTLYMRRIILLLTNCREEPLPLYFRHNVDLNTKTNCGRLRKCLRFYYNLLL